VAKKEKEDSQEEILRDDNPAETTGEEQNVEPEYKTEEDVPGEDDKMNELLETVNALKQENSDLKDQYLRKHADFENFRKRMAREKADAVKYGNQELLRDLIEVIDNFDRAIKSSEDSRDFDAFKEGISMTEQHFTSMLESKWGLKKLVSLGAEYDPNSHEALMMEESSDIEVPTVMEDYQSGFVLHDRVLRPAKVKVGKPVARTGAESGNGSAEEDSSEEE